MDSVNVERMICMKKWLVRLSTLAGYSSLALLAAFYLVALTAIIILAIHAFGNGA
ncbi:hypothetical protein D3C76_1861100 [compost metagenome]